MFSSLSPNSRLWVYTANRNLTEVEAIVIQHELHAFIQEWAAHGAALFGEAIVLKNRFLLIAVDEEMVGASGCSIDSSVRFVKSLGAKYSIDFFDRLKMIVDINGEFTSCHISELSQFVDHKFYNPMVTTVGDLNSNWLIPVRDSQFV